MKHVFFWVIFSAGLIVWGQEYAQVELRSEPHYLDTVEVSPGSFSTAVSLRDGRMYLVVFNAPAEAARPRLYAEYEQAIKPVFYEREGIYYLASLGEYRKNLISRPLYLEERQAWAMINDLGEFVLRESSGAVAVSFPEALIDSRIQSDGSSLVWLESENESYAHGVLGDRIEASSLRILNLESLESALFTVEEGTVIEDLAPRIGNGYVQTTLSSLGLGSFPALINLDGTLAAQGEAIGKSFRWMHSLGSMDFDGDGEIELAYVKTPHIGGTLILYEKVGDELVPEYQVSGVSTHRIGSRNLEAFAFFSLEDYDNPIIAVPDKRLRSIKLFTLIDEQFVLIQELETSWPVSSNIEVVESENGVLLAAGSEDFKLHFWWFPKKEQAPE
jgi:hypothetical protein